MREESLRSTMLVLKEGMHHFQLSGTVVRVWMWHRSMTSFNKTRGVRCQSFDSIIEHGSSLD
jgi:hypothetical protein